MQWVKTSIETNPKKLHFKTGKVWISEFRKRNNQEGFKEKFLESSHHTSLKTEICRRV